MQNFIMASFNTGSETLRVDGLSRLEEVTAKDMRLQSSRLIYAPGKSL